MIACFDCHSNQTQWPWYSNIAPASWLIQHDVDEGRHKLNYSEWGRHQEGEESAGAVAEGHMPPFIYLPAHPSANFSEADKAAFIHGLIATFGGHVEGGGHGGHEAYPALAPRSKILAGHDGAAF